MRTGVFTNEFAKEIEIAWNGGCFRDLSELKEYLVQHIDDSSANRANKLRISNNIQSANNFIQVLFTMYNHILAHPSEGLKVV